MTEYRKKEIQGVTPTLKTCIAHGATMEKLSARVVRKPSSACSQSSLKTMKVSRAGFTLIELLVAFTLFTVVMVVSVTVLLSLADANRKTQALKTTMDSVSAAIESMGRATRTGRSYDCSSSPTRGNTNDCASGGTRFGFIGSDNNFYHYRLNSGRIERCVTGGASCSGGQFVAMTPPSVVIEDMTFYVQGSTPEDIEQPHATITVIGRTGIGTSFDTNFTIQTTVTQRFPDI